MLKQGILLDLEKDTKVVFTRLEIKCFVQSRITLIFRETAVKSTQEQNTCCISENKFLNDTVLFYISCVVSPGKFFLLFETDAQLC